jgi:hypothetical protein
MSPPEHAASAFPAGKKGCQPFKDPTRIATKIISYGNEHSYKIDVPPCGAGLEAMTRHMHEFSSRVENLEIPPENERARFALFRHSLTTNSLSSARVGWDEVFENRGDKPLTRERFVELGKEWIARSAVERDRQDQVPCLRTIAKGLYVLLM